MEYRNRERSRIIAINPLRQWLYIYFLITLLALYSIRAHDTGPYNHTESDWVTVPDLDLDDDGILNSVEDENPDGDNDPSTHPTDTDGDGVPDYLDIDSDNDGIIDNIESQTTAGYIPPSGEDTDGNGLDDAYEETPGSCNGIDPIDTDGDGVDDYVDIDSDNDGIIDNVEAQDPHEYIAPCGIDSDGNGLDDHYEEHPGACGGLIPINSDGDRQPDFRDIDSDNDGIPDNVEGQTTAGYVPPTEMDDDGDGLDNAYEGSGDQGIHPENTDGEDLPDYLDDDTDNDLVPDNNEGNDFNFDGQPDQMFTGTDTDCDGLDDGYEGSDVNDGYDVNDEIDDPANDLPDTDGTEDVNYRDIDDDGDGVDTPDEDADMDGDPTDDDNNGNGTPNYLDPTSCGLVAADQTFTVASGTSGVVPDLNVLDNVTYLGHPVDPADITLTSEPTGGVTINPDGTITIEEGTPDCEVIVEYTICIDTDPQCCDTAELTVIIGPLPVIDAVDDEFTVESGSNGPQGDINVLDNDTLGGEPVDPADITLTSETTGGVTINPDGTITIAEGTPDGPVTVEYTICQNSTSPQNCDTAEAVINIGDVVAPIDAVDDEFLVETGTSGVAPSINVLDNDTLGGDPVDPADVTLTSETTGGVTINPDGTITIEEGTPDGPVTLEYTICEIANPENCDTAEVTVTIGPLPVIDAVDDEFTVESGSSGPQGDINVLDNDTLDGEPVDPADITLTSETTGGVTINPDGTITIAEGTPDGPVTVEYTICQNNTSPQNCDTAEVVIYIGPRPINAVDDEFLVESGSNGIIPAINVLSNDTLGNEAVDAEEVTLTSETTGGVTINPDGSISVEEGTPDGVVVLQYTICENADPENCDTAEVTITIGPIPPIDAVDDAFTAETGSSGELEGPNVLDNDTLGGEPVDPVDVILTSDTTAGVTINPDGTISIAEGTPDGEVVLEYTICQVTSPDNCDTATVTITIGPIPPIDAVDDDFSDNAVDGETGGTVPDSNVLDNDTLDGLPVTLSEVTISSDPSGPLSVNPDGTVSVDAETASGTYTIAYTICEIERPDNCDTAFVTVEVFGPIEVNQLVTPNGDGKNDFLFIRNVDRTLTNTLRIYNRWGVAVYEGDDYNNQNNVFDGRSRASATISVDDFLPDGVYYYIFDYQTVDENTTDSGFIYISQ